MARRPEGNPADAAEPPHHAPTTSFRITKQARTIAYAWRRALTEEAAYEWFKEIRFRDNAGEPFCPACGSVKVYTIESRPRWWSCAARGCRKQFSVTSGTILHSRKISFLKLADIVFRFAESAKGTSACELGIAADTTYMTMFVTLMKLREAMSSRRDGVWLRDEIEMDAAWFGGKARRENMAADRRRIDLRRGEHRRGKRAMMVLRQRDAEGRPGPSIMFAADAENTDIALKAVRGLVHIDATTKVMTDQAPVYNALDALVDHRRVDHSIGYAVDGINTNMAESSFSRARRAELGTYHHWSPVWLDFYAGEMCWREDRRRLGNMEQAIDIIAHATTHGQSRNLKGYWQNYQLPEGHRQRPEMRLDRVHNPGAPRRPRANVHAAAAADAADAGLVMMHVPGEQEHRADFAIPRPPPNPQP